MAATKRTGYRSTGTRAKKPARIKIRVPWQVRDERQRKNERLIYHMVGKVFPALVVRSHDWEDVVQVGRLVLWDCARRFDKDYGTKFSTYTCKALSRVFLRMRAEMDCRGFTYIVGAVAGGKVTPPTREALFLNSLKSRDDGDEEITDMPAAVYDVLEQLSPRDRHVMQQRYWEHKTYREIAAGMDITHERVRQLERRTLKKMREALGLVEPEPPEPPSQIRRCAHCKRNIPNVGTRKYCRPGAGCRKAETDTPAPLVFGSAVKDKKNGTS